MNTVLLYVSMLLGELALLWLAAWGATRGEAGVAIGALVLLCGWVSLIAALTLAPLPESEDQ